MEELVDKLALLQAELKTATDGVAADRIIKDYAAKITELETQVSDHRDALHDLTSAYGQDELNAAINEVKEEIVDEWDRQEKTMHFDAGTLKFITRKSLKVMDGGRLLEHIIANTSTEVAVDKYLKGFLLAPTKAYVDVHELGEGIAKINLNTTVKLEQKSG